MAHVLEAALIYLNAGLSVIPINKASKKPALDSWLEYGDRLPTEAEVISWFHNRDVNIGIVTGPVSGMIVVDVDDPSQYPKLIGEFPTNRVAQTPRGGYHLYYSYTGNDVKNSVKAVMPGVDVRGYHGYVVAPPSAGYEWLRKGQPRELYNGLKQKIQSATQYDVQIAQPGAVNNDRDAATLYNRVKEFGFTNGAHNQELKDVARYLYRMGEPESAIISIMAVLNAKDPTPLPELEMIKTINSGIGYERERLANRMSPDAREYEDKLKLAQSKAMSAAEVRQQTIDDFDAVPFGDLLTQYDDAANRWLIPDWLPESAVMVTAAPPESYKTWLGLEAGVNVAFGDQSSDFLGSFPGPKDGQPVLIVQQEDYMGLLMDRLSTIVAVKTRGAEYEYREYDELGEKVIEFGSSLQAPIYLHTKSKLSFEDDNSLAALDHQIKTLGIKYVMIDPLYMLGRADDYFASLARKMAEIKRMRDAYGTTFMFIHHNKKGTKGAKIAEAGERENMFGSQLLNGAFEGIWLLNTVSDNERVITRRGKVFHGPQDQYVLNFTIDTKRPRIKYYPEPMPKTDASWLGVPIGTPVVGDTGGVEYIDERVYDVKTVRVEKMPFDDELQSIIDFVMEMGEVTGKQVAEEFDISPTTANARLAKLIAARAIQVTEATAKTKSGKMYELKRQV